MSKNKKSFAKLKKDALLKKKDREMENLCKKCGLCCHVKVGLLDGNYVVHPTMPCKYLNNDNTCAVYDKRFNCDVKCFTREEMINKDYLLPEGCPYAELRVGYRTVKVVTQTEFDDIILKEIELGNYNVLLVNRIS